jgi:hypothetical protein
VITFQISLEVEKSKLETHVKTPSLILLTRAATTSAHSVVMVKLIGAPSSHMKASPLHVVTLNGFFAVIMLLTEVILVPL